LGDKKTTRPCFAKQTRSLLIGQQFPIDTNSMIHIFAADKYLLEALRGDTPPDKKIRKQIRMFRPVKCIHCDSQVLHGNGWRCRASVTTWDDWTLVWYWRLECQGCGKSHCLMPAIAVSDLMYTDTVIAEVVIGRLNGRSAREFAPDRRTQMRWLDRIRSWWPVALSSGAVRGALSEWTNNVSRVLNAICRCAASHIGLFFPSLSERNKTVASARRGYPAIGAHQRGSWILSAGL
jgi:hypothetical protein